MNKHPYIISRWVLFGLLFTFLVFTLPSCKDEPAIIQHGENNMAYKWSEIALQATARDTERMKPRPTVTSRYLALIFTAMFDAWSMYDENASPAYWTGKVIKPAESERTEHNKEIAISYAAYHTLMEFYPADAGLFTDYMKSLGINPEAKKNGSLLSPESIGIKAAEDVL